MAYGAADDFKKATMFAYTRISTDKQTKEDKKEVMRDGKKVPRPAKQKTTLKRQFKEIQDLLKKEKLPQVKPENWFAEVASGTKKDRTQWKALREAVLKHQGKAVVVVKDPSRWARNVDAAVDAWIPLKARETPVFAIGTGIQTGHDNDLRPSESFFFLLNSGFAAQTSQVQKKKAEDAVVRQKEEGVLAGKGRSVYPFARNDPLRVLQANLALLSDKGGLAKLGRLVELETMPNGMSRTATRRLIDFNAKFLSELNDKEQQEYFDVRDFIQEKLRELNSDPWATKGNNKGKTNFAANALYRMTGLYMKEPWNHKVPTFDFMNEVIRDFPTYLSDKDLDRRAKK